MSLNCGRISRPNDRTPRTHGSDIWQHRIEMETAKLPQKHSHFVTIFDLSQSSICYLSQFAKCHRRLQTTRLDKKGPKTLILAELPEKIEICPLSPIFHKQLPNCSDEENSTILYEPVKLYEELLFNRKKSFRLRKYRFIFPFFCKRFYYPENH